MRTYFHSHSHSHSQWTCRHRTRRTVVPSPSSISHTIHKVLANLRNWPFISWRNASVKISSCLDPNALALYRYSPVCNCKNPNFIKNGWGVIIKCKWWFLGILYSKMYFIGTNFHGDKIAREHQTFNQTINNEIKATLFHMKNFIRKLRLKTVKN